MKSEIMKNLDHLLPQTLNYMLYLFLYYILTRHFYDVMLIKNLFFTLWKLCRQLLPILS